MQDFSEKIHFLGHIVSNQGVEVDPEKVAAVSKRKSPRTKKELRAMLGLVGFYRRFIQDFGKIAEPLYKLLNKKERFTLSKEFLIVTDHWASRGYIVLRN